jgi:hypothetical protein
MNASEFMDKQIQGLAASGSGAAAGSSPPPSVGSGGGLADLMGPDPHEDAEGRLARRPQHHRGSNGGATDEVLPSYDFQPIRPSAAATSAVPAGSPPAAAATSAVPAASPPAAAASWGSLDSKAASSGLKVLGSLPPSRR